MINSFFHKLCATAPRGQEEKGKRPQSNTRTLLEALATAIDGTDAEETMRLAAEFNNAFRSLVRASVSTESEAAEEDLTLLGSFGPPSHKVDPTRQGSPSRTTGMTAVRSTK